jgi:flagellar biosynthesis anti-sigma factor FlgM
MSDFAINPAANGSPNHLRAVAAPGAVSASSANGAARLLHQSTPDRLGADRVELSDQARLLDSMRQMPEVRQDRIDRVRAAIARGGYETDAKINHAIERLIQEEDLAG